MPPEHVEGLRRRLKEWDPKAEIEARKRGEPMPDLGLVDPDVTFVDNLLPDHAGETYRGYEGLARAIDQWLDPYDDVEIDFERIVGSGDRVVSIHRIRMKARHTGIEFDSALAYVWTFRDGKIVHIEGFFDPAKALGRAGLRE
jgi:ketosteroid isomerase-like protein